jgi:hypothetical protein
MGGWGVFKTNYTDKSIKKVVELIDCCLTTHQLVIFMRRTIYHIGCDGIDTWTDILIATEGKPNTTIYIGMKNINILKRKCQVRINVVFLDVILKLYDVCFMKNIFIAP